MRTTTFWSALDGARRRAFMVAARPLVARDRPGAQRQGFSWDLYLGHRHGRERLNLIDLHQLRDHEGIDRSILVHKARQSVDELIAQPLELSRIDHRTQ